MERLKVGFGWSASFGFFFVIICNSTAVATEELMTHSSFVRIRVEFHEIRIFLESYNLNLDSDFKLILFPEKLCVMFHLNAYMGCFSGGHDNTACCERAGVGHMEQRCLDFCRPHNASDHLHYYKICLQQQQDVKSATSKCNHDGWT